MIQRLKVYRPCVSCVFFGPQVIDAIGVIAAQRDRFTTCIQPPKAFLGMLNRTRTGM